MRHTVLIILLALAGIFRGADATTYELPADGSDVVGEVTSVSASFEDTLVDIARRHGLGYQDIVRANPDVDVWVPGDGTEVLLPTRYVLPPGPREGIVLNLAEYRLYYFPKAAEGETPVVMTFPISIGRRDWETPIGTTTVVSKVVNPSWYPPQSVLEEHAADGRPLPRIVPPGPENPLGKHAMRLALPGYLIHGTNRPAGVGMRVTHGCLRMFPEDIEFLFPFVDLKTPVRIINTPVKVGWDGDTLVMEAHPVLEAAPAGEVDEPQPSPEDTNAAETEAGAISAQADDAATDGSDAPAARQGETGEDESSPAAGDEAVVDAVPPKDPLTYATEQFIVATGERPGELDWQVVEAVVERANGMPAPVGSAIRPETENAASSAAF